MTMLIVQIYKLLIWSVLLRLHDSKNVTKKLMPIFQLNKKRKYLDLRETFFFSINCKPSNMTNTLIFVTTVSPVKPSCMKNQ